MSVSNRKSKTRSKYIILSKAIGIFYHVVALELFLSYMYYIVYCTHDLPVIVYTFLTVWMCIQIGLFVLSGQGLLRNRNWAKLTAIVTGFIFFLPEFVYLLMGKVVLDISKIWKLLIMILLFGAMIYLVVDIVRDRVTIAKKKKNKRKLCKHCCTKLNIDDKICSYCGKELSEKDTMPI